MQGRGATTIVKDTGATPTDAKIDDAVAASADADLTVVLTMKAWDTTVTDKQAKQQKLVNALLATGRPVVVVAVRDPYDVAYFPAAQTTLATYGYAAVSMEALAKVLYGELAPAEAAGRDPGAARSVPDPAPVRPRAHLRSARHPADRCSYNIHAGAGSGQRVRPGADRAGTEGARRRRDRAPGGRRPLGGAQRVADTLAELAEKLGMYAGFAPIYDLDPPAAGQPRRQYGVGVVRFPLVRTENHPITRLSTQDPNPVPAPAPGFLEAEIDVRGRRVHVYSTHLDYRAARRSGRPRSPTR